jgi:hypothetical protein
MLKCIAATLLIMVGATGATYAQQAFDPDETQAAVASIRWFMEQLAATEQPTAARPVIVSTLTDPTAGRPSTRSPNTAQPARRMGLPKDLQTQLRNEFTVDVILCPSYKRQDCIDAPAHWLLFSSPTREGARLLYTLDVVEVDDPMSKSFHASSYTIVVTKRTGRWEVESVTQTGVS